MRENFERDEYVFKIYAPICSLYFANVVIRRREKLKNNIYIRFIFRWKRRIDRRDLSVSLLCLDLANRVIRKLIRIFLALIASQFLKHRYTGSKN